MSYLFSLYYKLLRGGNGDKREPLKSAFKVLMEKLYRKSAVDTRRYANKPALS